MMHRGFPQTGFLFLFLFLLSSCAASHGTAPSALSPETGRIFIVAVEAEPLDSLRANGWMLLGSPQAPGGEADLSLISQAASLLAEEVESRGSALEPPVPRRHSIDPWSPALTLAREAAMLIAAASECEVLLRKERFRLPASAQTPSRSVLQNWYRGNVSALKPEELSAMAGASVVEIGLSDLSLLNDQLVLQILTKRIDPLSGEVRARSRVHQAVTVGPPEELFRQGGEAFKALFADAGKRLLPANLREIGLLP